MTPNTHTTLTFYQFDGFFSRYMAISIMGFSKVLRPKGKGMLVGKLLGTGSGLGFSRKPNWGQYAHFAIWENEETADNYFQTSKLIRRLNRWAQSKTVLEMQPFQSRGIWDGKNPYSEIPSSAEQGGRVAILTRAKLKPKNILDFWKHVEPVNTSLVNSKGRLFSAGMGEWPFSHPITFSVWENIEAAKEFAYAQPFHSAAVKGAREGAWFKEDLFVRFGLKKFEQ
jgi:spheroidene monooxygenase